MNSGTLFLRGLGEQQRAVRKVERGQADLARDDGTVLLPAEAPSDHQVDHEEQVVLELEDQPLARTSQAQHALVFGRLERRIGRTEDEWTGQPNALQRL